MEFFDRKEEVLDIQLTPEGKRLLMSGKFKPFFYEFYDDDILYDSQYSQESEHQNDIEPRIKETPRIKNQSVIHGIETNLKISKDTKNKNKFPTLKHPLGLCEFDTQNNPAWNLTFLTGEISSSQATYQPVPDFFQNIPQLECKVEHVYEIRNDFDQKDSQPSSPDDHILFISDNMGENNYYLVREQNNPFIDISELNSVFGKENFDIEIFEVDEQPDGTEVLTHKYFVTESDQELTMENVETFFDILVDSETDLQLYKNTIKYKKFENYDLNPQPVSNNDPFADPNANNSQGTCE